MSFYEQFILEQQQICAAQGVVWMEVDFNSIVGVADNLILDSPTHGLRHFEATSSGWFVWSGEASEQDDFFKPYHLRHLIELKPEVVRYLALPPGFRFLIDSEGYEDIWFDEGLLI